MAATCVVYDLCAFLVLIGSHRVQLSILREIDIFKRPRLNFPSAIPITKRSYERATRTLRGPRREQSASFISRNEAARARYYFDLD